MPSAITPVGSVGVGQNSATGATLTISYTLSATATYLLVAVHGGFSAAAVSGVTWGGVAMTKLVESVPSSNYGVSVFGLANPTTGTANVVVTGSSSSVRLAATIQGFGGTSCAFGVSNIATNASSTTASIAISSSSAELVVNAFTGNYGNNKNPLTSGGGQVDLSNRLSTSWSQNFALGYTQGAGTVTTTYSWTGAMAWVSASVTLVPSGGGGGSDGVIILRRRRDNA